MKKLFLISLLCLIPAWNNARANVTPQNCESWKAYVAEGGGQTADYEKLGNLMKAVIDEQTNLKEWSNEAPSIIKQDRKAITNSCDDNINDEVKKFKIVELKLENLLNKYETLETQARMPFVHHGDVLPGPREGESGTDYVRVKFIPKYINTMLIFMISFSVLMVIVGGIMFIYSSGDSEMTGRAKTTIMWAILGVVITIFAYALVRFVIGIDFGI